MAGSEQINAVSEEKEAWLDARLPLERLEERVQQIDRGFLILDVNPIGFPYLLCSFGWDYRKFLHQRREVMHCCVDRCQGVSTTIETVMLGEALEGAYLPAPVLDDASLERHAKRHVMQSRRHGLKRRDSAKVIMEKALHLRKPLWKVSAHHPQYGDHSLLLDGVTGGYLFLNP